MKINSSRIPKKILPILKRIGAMADRQNLRVYAVGGFVRDLILRRGNLDLDIVIEGDAIVFAQLFAKGQKSELKIYRDFGTATLLFPYGLRVDFVTARKETYVRPGALPSVSPGSIKDDLFRRDFTINAMAMVLNPKPFGELVDVFGGFQDLTKGRIRILHDQSFIDDPTRILRAVRFEQRFDFRIDSKTLSLLKSAIQNGFVQQVTAPRYFEEFKKIFAEANPIRSIKRLYHLRGLEFLARGFRPDFAGLTLIDRNIARLRKNGRYKNYDQWEIVYLAGLIESWDESSLANLAGTLHLTREEKAILVSCPQAGSIIRALKKKNLKPRQIYEFLSGLPQAIICFIRVRTSVNIVGRYVDDFLKKYSKVKLKVTGEDLKRLGVPEGKIIGDVLHELLLRKIDGKLSSPAQELKEVNQVKNMIQESK